MYLEFVVGPILALLVSLKYSDQQVEKLNDKCNRLNDKIELLLIAREEQLKERKELQKKIEENEKEVLQKVMTTVLPIAKAVNYLNTQVGL